MANERPPQPVNGEILAVRPSLPVGGRRPDDVIDAVYETVREAEAPKPKAARSISPTLARENLSILNGEAAVADRSNNGGPAFWATGILAVAAAFWFSGGHALLDRQQGAIVPEQAGAFEVMDVTSSLKKINGRQVLLVDGVVQNSSMRDAVAPDIMVNVVSDNGRTTRYVLGLGKPVVAAGDTADFSSRLTAPEGGVKRVYITFEETR